MPVEARCEGCDKRMRFPDSVAGKRVKCPSCGNQVSVPGSGASSPQPKPSAQKERPSQRDEPPKRKKRPSTSDRQRPTTRRSSAKKRRRETADNGDDNPFGDVDLAELSRAEKRARAKTRECRECGEENPENEKYCFECGSPLKRKKGRKKYPGESSMTASEAQSYYDEAESHIAIPGWLIFVLIFVVGNIILFFTTGYVIIPRS